MPDGSGCVGTGEFQTLKADSLVLAVGQHSDVEFLKKVPHIRIGRGNVVEVDAHMRTGDGIFAGGDMIGGARTMTAAVGHGKKAALHIHAWLRGRVHEKRQPNPPVPYELLNLTVFLDADRREHAELPMEKRTLSLVWIALLSRRVTCSLAASRGVETDVEVVKYLLAAADVVMTASALLRHGVPYVATLREGLERWLGANGFA